MVSHVDTRDIESSAIAALFKQTLPNESVTVTESPDDAIQIVRKGASMVIMNPFLNGLDTIATMKEIQRLNNRRCKIMFLYKAINGQSARRAWDAGVDALILKTDIEEDLRYAIRKVGVGSGTRRHR